MKKQKSLVYKCSSCGKEEPKWLGRCPECGEWNTFAETSVQRNDSPMRRKDSGLPQALPLVAVDPMEGSRIGSGIGELDRVLGGGVMKRSSILVGGEPGIGKSTLLLQAAAAALTKGRMLYVSGEESAGQLRLRADRLGIGKDKMERIEILCSGNLGEIETVLNNVKPVLVFIDSAQTLFSENAGAVAGTVNQMKYCSFELIAWAKEHDAAIFLTAHVTKEGIISGPKTLEHMVDTVLYFEQNDKTSGLNGTEDCRFLRAAKNRFGSVDEIGIFTMGEQGLSPVEDTGRMFLIRRTGSQSLPPGVATAAVLEGSRTILVEIQALAIPAKSSICRVFSDKIDSGRVSRVSAALEKHLGLRLSDQDLYVNAAGGIRIGEVGVELALAFALYSARTGLSLPADLVIAGELSLTGEIRPVRRLSGRVKTSASLGFAQFLGPVPEQPIQGLKGAGDIKSAVKLIFGSSKTE
ncbi:MAG: DNA repair protein RadA [Treponema sp.]|nr:DNA repair protein RadA [Treponema sp.]MCL2237866.1 DNA repair protein RadA [Treponema sp.]